MKLYKRAFVLYLCFLLLLLSACSSQAFTLSDIVAVKTNDFELLKIQDDMSMEDIISLLGVQDDAVTISSANEKAPFDRLMIDLPYTVEGFPGFQWIYAAYYIDGVFQRSSISTYCEDTSEEVIRTAVNTSTKFIEELYSWKDIVPSGDYDSGPEVQKPGANCLIQYYTGDSTQVALMFLNQSTESYIEYPGYDSIFCISFDF